MDLRKKKILATLVFPLWQDKVLLARKTKKIGKGLWNGWGGMVEEGETIRQAALREFQSESGLTANSKDLEYGGKVTFHNQKENGRKFDVEVRIFLLKNWQGDVEPNPEMREPTFWSINNLPLDKMMPSDKDWLPMILAGEKIEVEVWHGPEQKTLLHETEIKIVTMLGDID